MKGNNEKLTPAEFAAQQARLMAEKTGKKTSGLQSKKGETLKSDAESGIGETI